jgi:hypothetical protein
MLDIERSIKLLSPTSQAFACSAARHVGLQFRQAASAAQRRYQEAAVRLVPCNGQFESMSINMPAGSLSWDPDSCAMTWQVQPSSRASVVPGLGTWVIDI